MNYSFKTISLLSSDPRIFRGIRDSTSNESKESSSLVTEVEYELDYDLLLDIIEPLKTEYQKDFILISKQDARIPSDVSYVKDEEALVSESKLALDDPSCSENKIVDIAPHDGDASKTDGKLKAVTKNEAKDYQDRDTFVVKRNLSHWKEKTKAIHHFAKAKILPIFAEDKVTTKIQEIQMKELIK